MTGLREELGQLIEDDDDRWYAFGFDKPSDPTTPEVPENLTVTPGPAGSGSIFCNCDDARRADKYRFVVADNAGTKLAEKLAEESEAMFTGLTAGATVKVTVTGFKTGGPESQRGGAGGCALRVLPENPPRKPERRPRRTSVCIFTHL